MYSDFKVANESIKKIAGEMDLEHDNFFYVVHKLRKSGLRSGHVHNLGRSVKGLLPINEGGDDDISRARRVYTWLSDVAGGIFQSVIDILKNIAWQAVMAVDKPLSFLWKLSDMAERLRNAGEEEGKREGMTLLTLASRFWDYVRSLFGKMGYVFSETEKVILNSFVNGVRLVAEKISEAGYFILRTIARGMALVTPVVQTIVTTAMENFSSAVSESMQAIMDMPNWLGDVVGNAKRTVTRTVLFIVGAVDEITQLIKYGFQHARERILALINAVKDMLGRLSNSLSQFGLNKSITRIYRALLDRPVIGPLLKFIGFVVYKTAQGVLVVGRFLSWIVKGIKRMMALYQLISSLNPTQIVLNLMKRSVGPVIMMLTERLKNYIGYVKDPEVSDTQVLQDLIKVGEEIRVSNNISKENKAKVKLPLRYSKNLVGHLQSKKQEYLSGTFGRGWKKLFEKSRLNSQAMTSRLFGDVPNKELEERLSFIQFGMSKDDYMEMFITQSTFLSTSISDALLEEDANEQIENLQNEDQELKSFVDRYSKMTNIGNEAYDRLRNDGTFDYEKISNYLYINFSLSQKKEHAQISRSKVAAGQPAQLDLMELLSVCTRKQLIKSNEKLTKKMDFLKKRLEKKKKMLERRAEKKIPITMKELQSLGLMDALILERGGYTKQNLANLSVLAQKAFSIQGQWHNILVDAILENELRVKQVESKLMIWVICISISSFMVWLYRSQTQKVQGLFDDFLSDQEDLAKKELGNLDSWWNSEQGQSMYYYLLRKGKGLETLSSSRAGKIEFITNLEADAKAMSSIFTDLKFDNRTDLEKTRSVLDIFDSFRLSLVPLDSPSPESPEMWNSFSDNVKNKGVLYAIGLSGLTESGEPSMENYQSADVQKKQRIRSLVWMGERFLPQYLQRLNEFKKIVPQRVAIFDASRLDKQQKEAMKGFFQKWSDRYYGFSNENLGESLFSSVASTDVAKTETVVYMSTAYIMAGALSMIFYVFLVMTLLGVVSEFIINGTENWSVTGSLDFASSFIVNLKAMQKLFISNLIPEIQRARDAQVEGMLAGVDAFFSGIGQILTVFSFANPYLAIAGLWRATRGIISGFGSGYGYLRGRTYVGKSQVLRRDRDFEFEAAKDDVEAMQPLASKQNSKLKAIQSNDRDSSTSKGSRKTNEPYPKQLGWLKPEETQRTIDPREQEIRSQITDAQAELKSLKGTLKQVKNTATEDERVKITQRIGKARKKIRSLKKTLEDYQNQK